MNTHETSCLLTHRKHRRTHSAGLNVTPNEPVIEDVDSNQSPQHLQVPVTVNKTKFNSENHINGFQMLGTSDYKLHRRSASYNGELFSNATREIGEVASMVVEQAEELMMHLLEKGWRVVHHSHLPHWLRDNDFLIWGHRPPLSTFTACFKSIFRIHTETVNIWTHLIGFFCFVLLCLLFLIQSGTEFPWQEKLVITVFFASAILALGFSWLFHTLHCHSEHVGKIFNKLDYVGIAVLTIGSFVPWLHYSFYCHLPSKLIYLVFILILGTICIIVSTKDKFCTPAYRSIRAGVFIALGLSGVVPCIHFILMEGFWEAIGSSGVIWLFVMAVLYISGALIYAMRVPERLYPGKFDIWFQSHQIFHVFVVLAALVHLYSILEIAKLRLSNGDCKP